jgi:hypothetical protein
VALNASATRKANGQLVWLPATTPRPQSVCPPVTTGACGTTAVAVVVAVTVTGGDGVVGVGVGVGLAVRVTVTCGSGNGEVELTGSPPDRSKANAMRPTTTMPTAATAAIT